MNTFHQLDFDEGAYGVNNASIAARLIPTLVCPSDDYTPDSGILRSSYAGCTGGKNVPIDTDNTGLLFLNSSVMFKQIKDGSSNTILLGERRFDDYLVQDLGWLSGTGATLRNSAVPINRVRFLGGGFGGGFGQFGGGPGNNADEAETPDFPQDQMTGGFSSQHTGGCTILLADGSVRYISENTPASVLKHLGDRDDGAMMPEF